MLAVFSKTQALDFKLIVRDTMLKSLDETENPVWENISKFGLGGELLGTGRREFWVFSKKPYPEKAFPEFPDHAHKKIFRNFPFRL